MRLDAETMPDPTSWEVLNMDTGEPMKQIRWVDDVAKDVGITFISCGKSHVKVVRAADIVIHEDLKVIFIKPRMKR